MWLFCAIVRPERIFFVREKECCFFISIDTGLLNTVLPHLSLGYPTVNNENCARSLSVEGCRGFFLLLQWFVGLFRLFGVWSFGFWRLIRTFRSVEKTFEVQRRVVGEQSSSEQNRTTPLPVESLGWQQK